MSSSSFRRQRSLGSTSCKNIIDWNARRDYVLKERTDAQIAYVSVPISRASSAAVTGGAGTSASSKRPSRTRDVTQVDGVVEERYHTRRRIDSSSPSTSRTSEKTNVAVDQRTRNASSPLSLASRPRNSGPTSRTPPISRPQRPKASFWLGRPSLGSTSIGTSESGTRAQMQTQNNGKDVVRGLQNHVLMFNRFATVDVSSREKADRDNSEMDVDELLPIASPRSQTPKKQSQNNGVRSRDESSSEDEGNVDEEKKSSSSDSESDDGSDSSSLSSLTALESSPEPEPQITKSREPAIASTAKPATPTITSVEKQTSILISANTNGDIRVSSPNTTTHSNPIQDERIERSPEERSTVARSPTSANSVSAVGSSSSAHTLNEESSPEDSETARREDSSYIAHASGSGSIPSSSTSATARTKFDHVPRHPTHWQSDGSVVIHVYPRTPVDDAGTRANGGSKERGMLFKLQKSTLARRSKYFERLFADGTSGGQDRAKVDGCKVFSVEGIVEDFVAILDALEDGGFKFAFLAQSSPSAKLPFQTFASLVRGSTAFEIESMRTWAVHAFEWMWPEKLDKQALRALVFSLSVPEARAALPSEGPTDTMVEARKIEREAKLKIALESVNLARICGVRKAVKRAMYEVVRCGVIMESKPGSLRSGSSTSGEASLSAHDFHSALQVRDGFLSEWIRTTAQAPVLTCRDESCLNYVQPDNTTGTGPNNANNVEPSIPLNKYVFGDKRTAAWTRAVHLSGLVGERVWDFVGGLAVLEGLGSESRDRRDVASGEGSDGGDVSDIPLPRLPNRDFVTYVDWQSLGWCRTCVSGMVNMWRIRRKKAWKDLDDLFEVNRVN